MSRKSPLNTAQALPHSWAVSDWPSGVFPGPGRSLYFVRANEDALVRAGCLVRIGRRRVVLGAPFSLFLQAGASKVKNYEITPNRPSSEPSAAA
jgi:hypothetical protein